MMDEGGYFYVCGNATTMQGEIDNAIDNILKKVRLGAVQEEVTTFCDPSLALTMCIGACHRFGISHYRSVWRLGKSGRRRSVSAVSCGREPFGADEHSSGLGKKTGIMHH